MQVDLYTESPRIGERLAYDDSIVIVEHVHNYGAELTVQIAPGESKRIQRVGTMWKRYIPAGTKRLTPPYGDNDES